MAHFAFIVRNRQAYSVRMLIEHVVLIYVLILSGNKLHFVVTVIVDSSLPESLIGIRYDTIRYDTGLLNVLSVYDGVLHSLSGLYLSWCEAR